MLKLRYIMTWTILALVAAPALLFGQDPQAAPQDSKAKQEEVAKLIGVLQSGGSDFDKAKACQRLAVIGTKEAVPVLAALLADEKFGHYARFGLEPIPDPSVDDALRDALGKLKGKLLVGVIDSIGVRRDAKAADALAGLLGDSDLDVASAAAAALGRIGGPQAAKALQKAVGSAPAALRPAVADACFVLAEGFAAQGHGGDAADVYDAVRKADWPKHLRVAATRGAILVRQAGGIPLLIEQLKAEDPAMFGVGLRAARELAGSEVTPALVAELDKLPPERQALLIQAIGDRPDASVAAMLKAAQSGPPKTRVAAVRLLGQLGDASVVPVLLEAAVQADAELAQAARAGLVSLKGEAVDAALAALLGQGDTKTRCVVIESAGKRRIASALPALLKAADEADPLIRVSALRALGETVGLQEMAVLTGRLVNPKTPEEAAAAQEALKAACTRAADRDACAEKLLASMPQASVAAKCALYELLGSVGGPKALAAVVAAAKDGNEEIQDTASRVLGEWMSTDAAPELLALAKASTAARYKIRALRGYIRIARQLDVTPDQRLAMCREALAAASRDDEKRLVLEVLRRNPSAGSLSLAVAQLTSPTLKEYAAATAVAIAERVVRSQPGPVAEAMPQVIKATGNGELSSKAKALLDQAAKRPRSR